jgi:hypothetical protein
VSRNKTHSRKKRRTLFGIGAATAVVVGLGALVGIGSAARSAAPQNTAPPTISGTPAVGQTLTAEPGNWTGTQPIEFAYEWRRCDDTGGSCSFISGSTGKAYTLKPVDGGNTLRVRVRATNRDGRNGATSVPTAVIKAAPAPPATGCPSGPGPVSVSAVTPPARLVVDQLELDPVVVRRGTEQVVARFHVSNTCGQAVQGALVYATAVPFNQLNVPSEQATDAHGWAEIDFQTLAGFPVSPHQQLLAMFVRARKSGESVLAGISSRRLVSARVDLSS